MAGTVSPEAAATEAVRALQAVAAMDDGPARMRAYQALVGRLPLDLIPWVVAGLSDTLFRAR